MSDDDLLSAGITPGTVRLSIGLENIDDLKQDLKQALKFL
jgi:O-acetylhomoserine (thiol)-lyase